MMRNKKNLAAHTQLERDRGSRRLSQVIDARRRLNAVRAASTRTKAEPLGPSDPRVWVPDAGARLARLTGAAFRRNKGARVPRSESFLADVSGLDPEVAAARSVRRATARRASRRRATARGRQVDPAATVIDFLAHHPGSTTGDLAKGLNLNRQSVSIRLTQLAKAGEIKKASHGYNTEQAARPRRRQGPIRRHAKSNLD
jgi:MarR family